MYLLFKVGKKIQLHVITKFVRRPQMIGPIIQLAADIPCDMLN